MIRAAVVAAILLVGPALADSRVVGGITADPAAYPWLVSLRKLGAHNCGGTLIAPDVVLTAAHCVAEGSRPASAASLSVAGIAGYSGVERVAIHPQYSAGTFANDIAVVRLVTPLEARPVALADLPAMPGDVAYAVGWGMTTYGGPASPTLQRADLTVIGRQDCGADLGTTIDVSRICAGAAATICQGDSGGPLMSGGVQIGLSAAVLRGCPQGRPQIYTAITAYRDWIAEAAGLPLVRTRWYSADGAPGQGWAIAMSSAGAFVGHLTYGADRAPTWTVATLVRDQSGRYVGAASVCRDGRTTRPDCEPAVGQIALAATDTGLAWSGADGVVRLLVPFDP